MGRSRGKRKRRKQRSRQKPPHNDRRTVPDSPEEVPDASPAQIAPPEEDPGENYLWALGPGIEKTIQKLDSLDVHLERSDDELTPPSREQQRDATRFARTMRRAKTMIADFDAQLGEVEETNQPLPARLDALPRLRDRAKALSELRRDYEKLIAEERAAASACLARAERAVLEGDDPRAKAALREKAKHDARCAQLSALEVLQTTWQHRLDELIAELAPMNP